MIKSLKSNKFTIILLLIVAILFISNPIIYANSCLSAVSVWAMKVFPTLFPFFIISRLIVSLSDFKSNPLDKYFSKIYNAPNGSLTIFLLSAISGYPMGAKLISNMYQQGYIDNQDAKKMLSFTSISGPMFMIGTVGVSIFGSFRSGLIIMISNILAGLLNGLIYRGKHTLHRSLNVKKVSKTNLLSDTIYDALMSIFMVGAYMVVSFLIIELLHSTNIINIICSVFSSFCNKDVVSSILTGIIEITRGSIDLSNTSISLVWKSILASTLIGFGGISIMMQSVSFLKELNISFKTILLQKTTQAIIAFLLSIAIAFLIL